MDILSTKIVKARKEYHCNFCLQSIQKKELYTSQINVGDDGIYNWRTHNRCSEIAKKLNMYDYSGTVNDSDFSDNINDAFNDIPQSDELIFNDPKNWWLETLEYVCDFHLPKNTVNNG